MLVVVVRSNQFQSMDTEEQEGGQSRKPWDSSGQMDPFRDDPPPLTQGHYSEDPVTAPEPSLADRPDVCTCGRCYFDEPVQDQQKCCHSIPRWQDEYESGSHIIAH